MPAKSKATSTKGKRPTTSSSVRPVAAIDVGSTSIRMAIAQVDEAGAVHLLDTLSQAVSIGKDSFTRRSIGRATTEECVRVLKSYRRVLQEYQITEADQIRAVATSAVREASNRSAFCDRIYIATGIELDVIDEPEVNRLTYLAIAPLLEAEPPRMKKSTLIFEIGGGITELLLVERGHVTYSETFRLGSLRLREMLESSRTPSSSARGVMENQIQRTLQQLKHSIPDARVEALIALGGDVRFAAEQIHGDRDPNRLARLPLSALGKLTDELLSMSAEDIVRRYHLTFPEAETVGPALLAYLHFGRAFNTKQLRVATVTVRDGLLKEMTERTSWTREFRDQIITAARALGKKFDYNAEHAEQVAGLSLTLFKVLQDEHRLDERYELILHIAALLHEIGLFVSSRSHHKHSMYLILNSGLFGLGRKDLLLVALVARYHRRASPSPTHEGYATLDHENRVAVAKMAAILRVADALDRSHSRRVGNISCRREEGQLIISVPNIPDMTLERLAMKEKGGLFEQVYGMPVMLRRSRLRTE